MGILDAPAVASGIFRGAWVSGRLYRTGDMVTNTGVLYAANTSFTSGVSFSAANWTVLSTQVGSAPATGLLLGRPSAFTAMAPYKGGLFTTTAATSATYRVQHKALIAGTGVRATIGNWYRNASTPQNDLDGPNSITVELTLFKNGVGYPLLFSGSRSYTLAPGENITTDLTNLTIDAADIVYLQSYVSVASVGMKWPLGRYGTPGHNEGSNYGTGGANLGSTTELPGGSYANGYCYGAVALTVEPLSTFTHRMVALSGDSITQGYAQGAYAGTDPDDYGYAQRICTTSNIPYVSIAYFGEMLNTFLTTVNRQRRMPYLDTITSAICGYGFNDLKTRTAAQIEVDLISHWTIFAGRSVPCYQTTIVPQTTSTDTWATTVNQTLVVAGWSQTQRNNLNAWLLDGAPISGGAPAATGAAGAGVLRAGAGGHPLKGVFDTASAVESGGVTGGTGKWNPLYTSDGIHPSSAGYADMAALINPALLV